MTDRLNEIFQLLPSCEVFADIGCDHGYMAKAMLEGKKAKRVIISDISAKCLEKAECLLSQDIASGRAQSVVSNGFERVGYCDLALIAGMGGEEIVSILSLAKSLPQRLVLQPMKNADKARVKAVELGYRIEKDFVFKSSGRFYDIMLLVKGKDCLNEQEIEFGRTNLIEKPQAFIEMIEFKIAKLKEYSSKKGLSESAKREMLCQMEKLEKYVKI